MPNYHTVPTTGLYTTRLRNYLARLYNTRCCISATLHNTPSHPLILARTNLKTMQHVGAPTRLKPTTVTQKPNRTIIAGRSITLHTRRQTTRQRANTTNYFFFLQSN